MHRKSRPSQVVRAALAASLFASPALLLSGAGGCKAIREHRVQGADSSRAAGEGESGVAGLPNENPEMSREHRRWLARQPIVGAASGSGSGEDDRGVRRTGSGMRVVDERSNPVDAPEPEISVEAVGSDSSSKTREELSYAQAVHLHATGDLQAALRELERAIAYNPQFTLAYLEAGDIYMELAEYERAEAEYARAVRNEPRNYMAQYRHAQVLHKLGLLEESNRAYLRALSIRPSSFDANLGISIVLLELGRAEQALLYGQRAVRAEPSNGRARMHLGTVYAALDRHEEAVIEFQQAAELMEAPTPGLLLNMAESLNQQHRYAEMVGALDQLVRIEPSAIAYERLGSGLFRLKRYDEALEAFRESARLDPDHFPAYNGVAVCELNRYLWSSKTDGAAREGAVEAMRQSLRINRDQPRIVELLRRYKDPSGREE